MRRTFQATHLPVACLALLLTPGPVRAEPAAQLVSLCRRIEGGEALDRRPGERAGAPDQLAPGCFRYVGSYLETVENMGAPAESGAGSSCMAEEVTTGRAIHAFLDYARQHPERGQEEQGAVLQSALEQAFPCWAGLAATAKPAPKE